MDFSRYDKGIAESIANVLDNSLIIEGANIVYFNPEKIKAKINKIDNERKIIHFIDSSGFSWWDYFMDANWRVLENFKKKSFVGK